MTDHITTPFLDLTPHTRDSERCRTTITVHDGRQERPWIKAGQSSLLPNPKGIWTLKSHLTVGHYDEEHDSAYAFGFDLVGVSFEMVHAGDVHASGWLHPGHSESFRIPNPDLQYRAGTKTCVCDRLDMPHVVGVPFFPKPNVALYRQLAGCKISITFGPGGGA
jgi:hypothetical protein